MRLGDEDYSVRRAAVEVFGGLVEVDEDHEEAGSEEEAAVLPIADATMTDVHHRDQLESWRELRDAEGDFRGDGEAETRSKRVTVDAPAVDVFSQASGHVKYTYDTPMEYLDPAALHFPGIFGASDFLTDPNAGLQYQTAAQPSTYAPNLTSDADEVTQCTAYGIYPELLFTRYSSWPNCGFNFHLKDSI